MASFAAAVMGFRVLAFEPVFENLQKICEGIYFNRVADLVTLFEAAASDHLGNITVHKVIFVFFKFVCDFSVIELNLWFLTSYSLW
jgi:FkbM family methyltransferase